MADDPNISDKLADTITTHSISVLRVAAGLRQDVMAMLKKLQARLVGDLEEHGPNPRLSALLSQTNETIDSAYQDIAEAHASNLEDIAASETQQGANLVNHSIGVEALTTGQSQRMIETIAGKTLLQGHYPAQWWDGQADDLKTRFKGAMQQGMLAGESVDDLVRRVRGSAKNNYSDGIMQASRAQAEALVRTSVQSVANESRINTYRANDDVVKGIQWLSTLDSRTTATCFTGSMAALPIGHIRKMFRRAYKGKIVVITTACGKEIEATPNHPILTARGWRAANEIQPRDQVFNFSRGQLVPVCENVKMEATFAAIADAIFDPAVSEIAIECSSPADFHGDGMATDEKVEIATLHDGLGDRMNSSGLEGIKNDTLVWLHMAGALGTGPGLGSLIFRGLPAIMPAFDKPVLSQSSVKSGLTDSGIAQDVAGAFIGLEPCERVGQLGARGIAGEILQKPEGLEERSNGCGCGGIILTDGPGAFAISPTGNDVIAVRIEDRTCHVYNFETSTGVYLAQGSIVHNCRALDGLQWDLDYRPIGHNKAFPGPIAHWGCRSTQIPITKSWAELSGKKVGVDDATLDKALQAKAKKAGMPAHEADRLIARTRASMDGQVAAKLNFGDWVATKSHAEQDAILGTAQAQLHRAGKITMAQLTDQSNRPLTVTQLRTLATQKQLIPPRTYVANQGGLTLHQRSIAQDQLATLAQTGNEITTFLNDDTGHTVSFQNALPTADHEDKIQEIDASTVVKTALSDNALLSATEARTYEKMGINELRIVRLDGSTINVGGEFTPQATDTLVSMLATSTTKNPEKKLVDALKGAGFRVSRTKANNVQQQITRPL